MTNASRKFTEVARGKVIWFAEPVQPQGAAEFRAENIEERGVTGSAFDFVSPAGRARLDLPLIGRHNVMNAIAALAAASVWGIGAEDAQHVFPSLKPADKRGEVVKFAEGFTVINDSYNSSPTALNSLAELLAETPGFTRRKILAAGEMLELGDFLAGASSRVRPICGKLQEIDWIVGVQGEADNFMNAAIAAGHPQERAKFFQTSVGSRRFPIVHDHERRPATPERLARRENGKNSGGD